MTINFFVLDNEKKEVYETVKMSEQNWLIIT